VGAKAGRFGPYVTELLPEDAPSSAKPRTSSLAEVMRWTRDAGTPLRSEALHPAPYPRELDLLSGPFITAGTGLRGRRHGGGGEAVRWSRSYQLFTWTLDRIQDCSPAKPAAAARGSVAPPLRELVQDPSTGKPMVDQDVRFGPYVTDGDQRVAAQGDDVPRSPISRRPELLADRRAAFRRRPSRKTTTTRKKSATPARSGSKRSELCLHEDRGLSPYAATRLADSLRP